MSGPVWNRKASSEGNDAFNILQMIKCGHERLAHPLLLLLDQSGSCRCSA